LKTDARYSFGPFELDPEARLLRRDGKPVPLAGRNLDTLVLLLENRGRLVDKEELLSHVWGGTVVEEANLTQTIFTLRKTLGDSPKDRRYIATVSGRGYQFVAPVTGAESGARTEPAGNELKGWAGDLRKLRIGLPGIALSGLLLIIVVFMVPRQYLRKPLDHVLKSAEAGHNSENGSSKSEWQLTANPEDTPVTSGAISPDGKLLVYSDPTGLYTKQADTGETHPIPLPKASVHWSKAGSRMEAIFWSPGRNSRTCSLASGKSRCSAANRAA
jgi:DNA-binding winged helix-turn-helix (wHTH) protein